MKTSIILAALAVTPAAAFAQTDFTKVSVSRPGEIGGELVQERIGHLRASLAIYGRVSFPGDSDVTLDGITYSDFFDPGLGVGIEGDLMPEIGEGLSIGGYASVNWDTFHGVKVFDDFGDSVDPDRMDITTFIVGGKVQGQYGPGFFWEGRLGLGWVHYEKVESTNIFSGVMSTSQEFFAASNRAVFEIAGRAGWGTPRFAVDFGLGYRLMGAPTIGKDAPPSFDPDLLDTLFLEIGFMIRF